MHFIKQATCIISFLFEAQLVHLATCNFLRSTFDFVHFRMNTIKMDRLTYVRHLKLNEKQELQVHLVDSDPHFDNLMMLGSDFATYSTKTEQALWKGLVRAPLHNFPGGDVDTSGLTHFTFFTVLPLNSMMDFMCKKELCSKDFTFCGEGLPINLSLNARSAVLFF
jgi:hypothetical protein